MPVLVNKREDKVDDYAAIPAIDDRGGDPVSANWSGAIHGLP
jgi:hypothetical protein